MCIAVWCATMCAVAATEQVTIGYHQVFYSEEEGDYRHSLYSLDGRYQFDFDMLDQVQAGVTYTQEKNMNDTYTGCTDYQQMRFSPSQSATFTLTMAEGLEHIEAEMTLQDGRTFAITYQQRRDIVATDTVEIKSTDLNIMDWTESMQQAVIMANTLDKAYAIEIWLNTPQLLGNYRETNLNLNYSQIIDAAASLKIAIQMAEFTITMVGRDYLVEGYLLGSNNRCYHLQLGYEVPLPSREVDVLVEAESDAELENRSARYGYIEYKGYNMDVTYQVTLSLLTDELREGVYTRDNLYANYSSIKEVEEDKTMLLIDANLTLELLSESTAKFTGWVIGQNKEDSHDVARYNVTLYCRIIDAGQGLEYDATLDDFDATFTNDEAYLVTDFFESMSQFYLEAYSEQTNAYITLCFNMPLDAKMEDGILPGTYPIDRSGNDFTMMASEGARNGQATPSFVGYIDPVMQQLNVPVWFLVAGQAVVSTDAEGLPRVEVSAQNSNGRKIELLIAGLSEGVEVVRDTHTTTKTVENGQLIISRAGVRYNIYGVQL